MSSGEGKLPNGIVGVGAVSAQKAKRLTRTGDVGKRLWSPLGGRKKGSKGSTINVSTTKRGGKMICCKKKNVRTTTITTVNNNRMTFKNMLGNRSQPI